jgi:glycosyltransferase involved in cell wall biosynthesis
MNQISLVIPSHNNLRHIKNAYASIKKHAPEAEVIMIDDASTDGTYEWLKERLKEDDNLIIFRVEERLGHTILYDYGIDAAKNDVVGIMHADMIMGPNYVQNVMKHLQKGVVVCGTRIEPPLHPPGNEKIIQNFGMDFNDLNVEAFEDFCLSQQEESKDQTTNGMFAPWIIYKEDFLKMGGHDHIFAPFPYEDSDIFERWILSGYKLVQSRDAFVYHLTCRGHRWTDQVGKDDDFFKRASQRAAREYLRKWGSWIQNDQYQHPIIKPKYDIGFVVENCTLQYLAALEPLCSTIYLKGDCDQVISDYFKFEQPNTKFDLSKRVLKYEQQTSNDITVEFDCKNVTNEQFSVIQQFNHILKESGEVGIMELDAFKFTINAMNQIEKQGLRPVWKHQS